MGSWKWILIRIPLIFLQYLHFQNGCYEIFMVPKQCYFYLRGHTHFLGSLGAGLFGAVCAFSEECSFQRRLLLLQFSGQGTSCCMLAACARLLCMHSWSCVCMLALYTGLLHIQAYCVCIVTVYVQMLCLYNYYVCTLAMHARLKLCTHAWGWGIPGPIPSFPVAWGRSTGQGCTSTQKVSMHCRCGCYTV